MKLAFRIASRFLLSSRGQTILILTGIIIGVSVQVFIGSLIDGLQKSLVDSTVGSSSQVTIESVERNQTFPLSDDLLADLDRRSDLTAVSPVFSASAFMVDDEATWPVLMRGFDFARAEPIYKTEAQLAAGRLPAGTGEVLLGTGLAELTGYTVGDTLMVLTPSGDTRDLLISGIFDLKVASLNETWLLSDLATTQALFAAGDEVSAVEMQVEAVFAADETASLLADSLPADLKVTDWKVENEQLLSALSGQSASSYMIQVFVLLAVLLGISSVLAISVVQKSRQIGILKAMGIRNRTSRQIFLIQGFLLGLIGALAGVGLGLGLSAVFSTFVRNADGTPLVPFYFDPVFVSLSFLIAVAAATVSSMIPAGKSAKLNPIEVIRNG
ncbi:MAG: FtsX-like permease family protein [Eubacteriales bacterium]|nr:FtsX-like permease family protein [Eubacteriales bacterium]MDD4462246.1 FtsX-like permease family protein [Eubacteriales bacterium]